jgi:hypothetical protein
VRIGPGAARTILLLHIISASPSKQPLMVHAGGAGPSIPPRIDHALGESLGAAQDVCTHNENVHGHALLRLSRGTNASEPRFCSAKVRQIPYILLYMELGSYFVSVRTNKGHHQYHHDTLRPRMERAGEKRRVAAAFVSASAGAHEDRQHALGSRRSSESSLESQVTFAVTDRRLLTITSPP